ncbi:MAG: DedA family protein [Cypionkella sp.]|nr:DedA family protein [Cypionkella sp.]
MQDWVFQLVEGGGYAGVLFLMFLETMFPPIPSEVIMPIAGIVAASGALSLSGVIVAGTLGAMLGNTLWYLLALWIGIDRFQPLIERHGRWLTIDWPDVERAQAAFGRYGGLIVFFGRMIPSIRSVISIPAGLLRMRLPGFLIWSTIGTSIWSSGLAIAGWALGTHVDRIEEVIGPVSTAVVVAVVGLYIWRQITWSRRRSREGR